MLRKRITLLMAILALSCTLVTPVFASNDNSVVNEVMPAIISEDIEVDSDENVTVEPRVAQYVWTNTALNVRTGPGTKYKIVKTLPKNTKLWITNAQYDEYGNDWYKCVDVGGWVCANYVRYKE